MNSPFMSSSTFTNPLNRVFLEFPFLLLFNLPIPPSYLIAFIRNLLFHSCTLVHEYLPPPSIFSIMYFRFYLFFSSIFTNLLSSILLGHNIFVIYWFPTLSKFMFTQSTKFNVSSSSSFFPQLA